MDGIVILSIIASIWIIALILFGVLEIFFDVPVSTMLGEILNEVLTGGGSFDFESAFKSIMPSYQSIVDSVSNIDNWYASLDAPTRVLLIILITLIDLSMFFLSYHTWKKGKELDNCSRVIGLGEPVLATIWIEFILFLILSRFTNILPIAGIITTPPIGLVENSDFNWIIFLVSYIMRCIASGFQVIIERGELIIYDPYWGNIIAALIVLLILLFVVVLTIKSFLCIIKTIVRCKYTRKLYLCFFFFSLILCVFGWVPFLALAVVLTPVIAVCLACAVLLLVVWGGNYGDVETSRRSTVEKWITNQAVLRGDDIYYDPSTGTYVSVDSDGIFRDEYGTPRRIIERSSTQLKDERGNIYRRSIGGYKNGDYRDYDDDD